MAFIGTVIIVLIIICAAVYLAQLVKLPPPFEWVTQALVILVVAGALIWLVAVITGAWPVVVRVP